MEKDECSREDNTEVDTESTTWNDGAVWIGWDTASGPDTTIYTTYIPFTGTFTISISQ